MVKKLGTNKRWLSLGLRGQECGCSFLSLAPLRKRQPGPRTNNSANFTYKKSTRSTRTLQQEKIKGKIKAHTSLCPVLTVRLSRCWRGVIFEEITKPNTGNLMRVVMTRRSIIILFLEQFKNIGKLSTYITYSTRTVERMYCNYVEDFRISMDHTFYTLGARGIF